MLTTLTAAVVVPTKHKGFVIIFRCYQSSFMGINQIGNDFGAAAKEKSFSEVHQI